jgi:hypothetical protein
MDRIIDELKEMNAVLEDFQNRHFRLVGESREYQRIAKRLTCNRCGRPLKMTVGKWTTVNEGRQRVVVMSSELCREYFYVVQQQFSGRTRWD